MFKRRALRLEKWSYKPVRKIKKKKCARSTDSRKWSFLRKNWITVFPVIIGTVEAQRRGSTLLRAFSAMIICWKRTTFTEDSSNPCTFASKSSDSTYKSSTNHNKILNVLQMIQVQLVKHLIVFSSSSSPVDIEGWAMLPNTLIAFLVKHPPCRSIAQLPATNRIYVPKLNNI